MRDRLAGVIAVLVIASCGIAAAVVWWPGTVFFYVVGAFLLSHAVTIPSPSGRRISLTAGVGGAVALSTGSPVLVVAAAAAALPLATVLLHVRYGRRVVDDAFPAEPLGLAVFSVTLFGLSHVMSVSDASNPVVFAAFSVGALLWFATAVIARTIWTRQGRAIARRIVWLRAIADWPAYAALFSSAALYAVTVGEMGPWAVPLAGLPYIFSHLSLHRLGDTRRTYDQTIGALGAIPEASGQVAPGHASRCADLAVAVGAEMGIGIAELRRIEYAALLHDIGRVVLGNPAMAQREYSFSDVSGWSAAIISEARYLEPVATIVASQHEPYRKPGEERDPDVPIGSQIVRIVARFDSALDDDTSAVEACELLHRGAAYEYDPQVVMALRRVLERRGVIA